MDFVLNSKLDSTGSIWKVQILGEIDIYNSAQLKEKLTKLIEEKEVDIEIDCKHLEYIDSTGLGSLVSILKKVKQYNGNVHLVSLKSNVFKVFKITGLTKVFIIEGVDHE